MLLLLWSHLVYLLVFGYKLSHHFFSYSSRRWLKTLRTIQTKRASLMSTWLCGSTHRAVTASKLEILSLTSSVRCVCVTLYNSLLSQQIKKKSQIDNEHHIYRMIYNQALKPLHVLLHPLGWLDAGSQSESLCFRAAPEAGGSQSGHPVLPGPAGPPCGVSNLWSHRGHRQRAHSHVAGWVNYRFGETAKDWFLLRASGPLPLRC